ncbi:MAG TPA: PaaI family thioesterase [Paludibacteraceae bacterium]|nr:PaaI family thioesterase [Paludibacteraceae bacterium]
MKKIKNPLVNIHGYECFGCSRDNEHGLHMDFYLDEENKEVVCFWEPQKQFQSWTGILHGGIQCTMIDEIAAWANQYYLKTCGVTAKMETKYIKPVRTDQGQLTLRSKIDHSIKNITIVKTKIFNYEGELCTKATSTFFNYPQEIAIEKFRYQDLELEEVK